MSCEGEFVCFLGPSGCGKTTLLRAIAGLDIQTTGTIEQAGADISALPPSERDFGIVFQSYALFPNMTVTRNVAYGLESQKRSRAEVRDRVRDLLELVGLPDQGDKYPAQLSGGQQQRIALARAIAMSPGLLLLDEPLSALDAKVRARLRYEVKSLQRRLGITTIMVTHDQEEALTMADRIVVMNHGVIEQVGAPAEIYREPASVFVADFIGTMNFLAAEVGGDAAPGERGDQGRRARPCLRYVGIRQRRPDHRRDPARRHHAGGPGERRGGRGRHGHRECGCGRRLRRHGRVRRIPRLVRPRRAQHRGRASSDRPADHPAATLRSHGGKHRAGGGASRRRAHLRRGTARWLKPSFARSIRPMARAVSHALRARVRRLRTDERPESSEIAAGGTVRARGGAPGDG